MNINKINKKILCLLCMVLVFINALSIHNFSYGADSTPVMDNLENYSYKQRVPSATYDLINQCENESVIKDDSFFYFIYPVRIENGSLVFKRFLINKAYIKNIYFRFSTDSSNGMYYSGLYIYFPKDNCPHVTASGTYGIQRYIGDLINANVLKLPDGTSDILDYLNYCIYDGNDSSYNYNGLVISGYSYFSNDTYTMPYATNFPYEIEGSSVDFYKTDIRPIVRNPEPYLLNSVGSLQMSNYEFFGIMEGSIAPSLVDFDIINTISNEVALHLDMENYIDYVSRYNVNDPFSEFSYNIPLYFVREYTI